MGLCCSKDEDSSGSYSAKSVNRGPMGVQSSATKSMSADECKRLLEMREENASEQRRSFKKIISFKDFQSFKEVDSIQDVYSLGKELGKGSFGSVNLAKHRTLDSGCAIKVIKKSTLNNPTY